MWVASISNRKDEASFASASVAKKSKAGRSEISLVVKGDAWEDSGTWPWRGTNGTVRGRCCVHTEVPAEEATVATLSCENGHRFLRMVVENRTTRGFGMCGVRDHDRDRAPHDLLHGYAPCGDPSRHGHFQCFRSERYCDGDGDGGDVSLWASTLSGHWLLSWA